MKCQECDKEIYQGVLCAECHAFSGTSQTPCSVECKQCVELAKVLSALLADYEHMVFDEGHGGPIGNMVLARTLLNDITQNDKLTGQQKPGKGNDMTDNAKPAFDGTGEVHCSAWIPVEAEPVPNGLVCDMVREGWDRLTNVVYLDDDVWPGDALYHDPNGNMPDPIDICPIGEITHWAKIVLPNDKIERRR
jgi:hypothetical protein